MRTRYIRANNRLPKADFAFGKPFQFLTKQEDSVNLIQTIDTRGEVLNALGHIPPCVMPWMRYFFVDKFWSHGLRATSSLESIGRLSFHERQNSHDHSPDLMGLLLSTKDPEKGGPLPSQEIIAEAISFIVGGSDTTSSTMSNFVDLVSRRPDIQRKLQQELDSAFPGTMDPDWVAPDAVVGSLPFLNATLKEVMRIRPTSSTGLERVVPAGGKLLAGHFFPQGVRITRSCLFWY
jgi:benzoate 4-monooxygenase